MKQSLISTLLDLIFDRQKEFFMSPYSIVFIRIHTSCDLVLEMKGDFEKPIEEGTENGLKFGSLGEPARMPSI
jgi:hypothetical protein